MGRRKIETEDEGERERINDVSVVSLSPCSFVTLIAALLYNPLGHIQR